MFGLCVSICVCGCMCVLSCVHFRHGCATTGSTVQIKELALCFAQKLKRPLLRIPSARETVNKVIRLTFLVRSPEFLFEISLQVEQFSVHSLHFCNDPANLTGSP